MDDATEDDTALIREQLAYVDSAAKDCPFFAPDERQSMFYGAMEAMKATLKDCKVISMSGYPASYVNIGWLKSRAEQVAKELLLKHGDHYVARVIELVIDRCVQRLRFLSVFPNSEANLIDVRFRTADDVGYYEYGFLVVLPVDWKDDFAKAHPELQED